MADVMSESAYNDDLAQVAADPAVRGLFTEDNGALCVFLEELKNVESDPLPVIVQKTGGDYLYVTTDLVAIRYRHNMLRVGRVLYLIDQRQALHFQQVFKVARRAGLVPAGMKLEHMGFGTTNGVGDRPFKARDGGMAKLTNLLEETESRAYALVKECNKQRTERGEEPFDEVQLREIGRVVGTDSVKYADLSKHRTDDYSFNFELMLSFKSNIAPHLLYACIRATGVFCKLG